MLLVTACWRTNWTLRQLAPTFGVSNSAADRVIRHLGPLLARRPRKQFRKNTVLIVDGIRAPTHDCMVGADGYRGTGLVIPYRRECGQHGLPAWKEEHNASHRQIRTRVEHALARMKAWKVLRDRRLKGDRVHHAMSGIARLHNLTLRG